MIQSKYKFTLCSVEKPTLSFNLEATSEMFRISVLDDHIIRVSSCNGQPVMSRTWMVAPGQEDIPLEGRNRDDYSLFKCPEFKVVESEDSVLIETAVLRLHVSLDGLKMTWYGKNGKEFEEIMQDRQTQSYNLNSCFGKGVYHYIKRSKHDAYYGLGERTGHINRNGNYYTMKNVDPMGYDSEFTDPLYKHIPFYITRNHSIGMSYGLFYDNLSTSHFDMGKEMDNYHGAYRYYHAEAGDLDFYFIFGPKINDVTTTFSWMTGKTIMPPKWSLGYSGSTMHYTDAPNAQEQLLKFVDDCRKHDIPCQSFQLSSGYTSIGDRRYVFNWNYNKIPDPVKLSSDFHDSGLKLCANIKPALLIDHPMYNELDEKGLFIKDRKGEKAETAQFWDEIGSYVDFTNPEAFLWWKEKVKTRLLEMGIDSTWNDNNEYEIWDDEAKAFGFGSPLNVEHIRPLFSLLMMKASYEAQMEQNPDLRPYLISRSGCPGMQKYVQTWSGDNHTDYKTIRFNSKMGVGLSLSGIYNIGHDVGGFAGPAPEPELFLRWIQNGIFNPRFTIHSWNDDCTVNEPWMYPEILGMVKKQLILRMQLVPFFYNLLYKAHKNYEPVIRPTFYNYEEDDITWLENDEFMLGDDLLIASVFEKGMRDRTLYLPKDPNGWYEYNSGTYYNGGQTVTVSAPLENIPFFVRCGAIIPLNSAVKGFESKEKEERVFRIFPLKTNGSVHASFYEDDGTTVSYKQGNYAHIHISVMTDAESIRVKYAKEGKYELSFDDITFNLPENEKRKLIIEQASSL